MCGLPDAVVVTQLARMSRSQIYLLHVVQNFERQGIEFVSLRQNIDTLTPTGRAFLAMMGVMSQWERELKAERIAAECAAANSRGRTAGLPLFSHWRKSGVARLPTPDSTVPKQSGKGKTFCEREGRMPEDRLPELAQRLGEAVCALYPEAGQREAEARLVPTMGAQGQLEAWVTILEEQYPPGHLPPDEDQRAPISHLVRFILTTDHSEATDALYEMDDQYGIEEHAQLDRLEAILEEG